jgi:3-oxoadipate enol-lactonase
MAWAQLTDVRCYYEVSGHGDPLLLVPGLGVTSRIWDNIVPDLAEHFSVIRIDNRGIGRSTANRHPHTLRDYAADILELLDLLQIDRAHVMGLSLGGMIAQQLAEDHPVRLNRLVLVSCTDRFTPYLRHVARLLGQSARKLRGDAFARTIEILGSSPLFLDQTDDLFEQRVKEKCAQKIPIRAIGRQLRCLARIEQAKYRAPIQNPTLVLAGEHDFLIPNCYARAMADRIAGSRFMVIPGAGHNPLVECPDQILPKIIDFLKEARTSSKTDSHVASTSARRPLDHCERLAPTAVGGTRP